MVMILAPARAAFPDANGVFQDSREADYITRLTQRISLEINARTRDDSARPQVLLLSPNGSVFALVVDDFGALTSRPV